jgi:hypothetical protein
LGGRRGICRAPGELVPKDETVAHFFEERDQHLSRRRAGLRCPHQQCQKFVKYSSAPRRPPSARSDAGAAAFSASQSSSPTASCGRSYQSTEPRSKFRGCQARPYARVYGQQKPAQAVWSGLSPSWPSGQQVPHDWLGRIVEAKMAASPIGTTQDPSDVPELREAELIELARAAIDGLEEALAGRLLSEAELEWALSPSPAQNGDE